MVISTNVNTFAPHKSILDVNESCLPVDSRKNVALIPEQETRAPLKGEGRKRREPKGKGKVSEGRIQKDV